jgi:hypothetical protein
MSSCKSSNSLKLILHQESPIRLKKELEKVLTLQTELLGINTVLQNTQTAVNSGSKNKKALKIIKTLRSGHKTLQDQVDNLYESLNLPETFPQLSGVGLEFINTLLLARDLKINIRHSVIGSWFEIDWLDQAAGGKANALGLFLDMFSGYCAYDILGTKLHQHTRKQITKRKPAIINSLNKFNSYCDVLAKLYNPACNIPLPQRLPIKLAEL